MKFNVQITLHTVEPGRGIRVFNKEIEAETAEQAQDMVKQMFEGFLADGVTVETKTV